MESNVKKEPVLEEQFNPVVETANVTSNESSKMADPSSDADHHHEINQRLEELEHIHQEGEDSTADITAGLKREQLIALLGEILESRPVQTLRKDVEAIKVAYYKERRTEVDTARRLFGEAGGDVEAFAPEADALEPKLKELLAAYRKKRDEHLEQIEQQKEESLKVRLEIIEELKTLVNSNETVNHTFATFRQLQTRWKESGAIPKAQAKDIWESYHLHVENFYNYVKINNELRDLDLKKNYETKIALCEEAEALMLEASVLTAFRRLQKLHEQWREVGPVALQYKEQLWSRFKDASTQINKKHQEYFDSIKDEQKRNLELKTQLCVKAEELADSDCKSSKEWTKVSDELIEVQKVWKSIGFAPKKDNTKIYERFRAACDKLFDNKRNFFLSIKSEMDSALEAKTALCVAAEALSDSTEWKKSSAELILLQKQWKEVGAVSRKHSDIVWKRFRAACDKFFDRKGQYYAGLDGAYEENLKLKEAICEKIENLTFDSVESGFNAMKALQREWTEVGFVPMKSKDAIMDRYRKAVDKQFATLRGGDRERKMERFKNHVSSIKDSGDRRVRAERERIMGQIRQKEADITLLENNIGFFAHSKGAEKMIADIKVKTERARAEIVTLKQKIAMLDEAN